MIDSIYGHMDKNDEAAWLANQSYYFNCIRDVSRQVDHVLQALEDSGQLDNTIIVYTADHGEMAGAHGLRQKGPVTYKENSRVPLIVSHPDVSGGRTVDNLGSALDLVPTLVGLATEGKTGTDTPGVDLSPALSGQTTQRDRDGILFAYGVLLYTDPEATQRLAREGDEITPVKLMGDFLKQLAAGPGAGQPGPAPGRLRRPLQIHPLLQPGQPPPAPGLGHAARPQRPGALRHPPGPGRAGQSGGARGRPGGGEGAPAGAQRPDLPAD